MAKDPEPQGKLHEITGVRPFLSIGICGRRCCFADGDAKAVRRFSLDSGREGKSIAASLGIAIGVRCFAFDQGGSTRLAGPDAEVYATIEGSDDDSEAQSECWWAATAFYSTLSRLTGADPKLEAALKPVIDFFATGRRKKAAEWAASAPR
jgi:hypothetical protein